MSPQGGSLKPELTEQQEVYKSVCICACLCAGIDRVYKCRLFQYLALALVMPSEAQQLFMLPRHKVDSSVLQQCREDKQETHCHPDVYGLDIRDL